jgi:hypothetical protein
MQNYDEIVLFWLQPSNAINENLREDIDSLQEIINDTRVFYDRDQCIETLQSIVDQTIFLVLGIGQSDLIDILSSFTYLEYIYLQEPSHFPYTSQVRGVFRETKQLLHQLKKDIKTVHNTYTHLGLSRDGELQQPQNSTQNLQCRAVEFKWVQLLFEVLLNTTRPTENIHEDLLDECRLIYRGNEPETRFIDEFAAEYEPSKAIWWYTRNTFLYKLINMALRTENMMIIWKFRFIIQDIYQQLKSMHEKQKNATIGMCQSTTSRKKFSR